MLRTPFPLVPAAAVIGALVALHGAALAGEREGERRSTNTFVLVISGAAKPQSSPAPSSNGVGVPPAKPVLSNPYQVPLLQNAGTLRGTR